MYNNSAKKPGYFKVKYPNVHISLHLTSDDLEKKSNVRYNIKISSKTGTIDQKREQIELIPGYHLTIRVIPKVGAISENTRAFSIQSRDCKLPHETDELKFFKKPNSHHFFTDLS